MTTDTIFIDRGGDRVCMGDILSNVEHTIVKISDDKIDQLVIVHKRVIVLTQDCDLEQDFNTRALPNLERKNDGAVIQSILFCPIYTAEKFKTGEHLSDLNLRGVNWEKDLWKPIRNNIHKRFYFINEDKQFEMPSLIIDFKDYFTLPRDVAYDLFDKSYVTSVKDLFREDIAGRFAHYFSRIGLPSVVDVNTGT